MYSNNTENDKAEIQEVSKFEKFVKNPKMYVFGLSMVFTASKTVELVYKTCVQNAGFYGFH